MDTQRQPDLHCDRVSREAGGPRPRRSAFASLSAPRRIGRIFTLAALAAIALGLPLFNVCCSEDSSPGPSGTPSFQALAGGGRTESSDPFIGGPRDSGPNGAFPGLPDIDPATGPRPMIYLDNACGEAPAHTVITDSTAWRIWWEANTSCLNYGGPLGGEGVPGQPPRDDGAPGDSGVVWPDSTDPGPWGPPEVDFGLFSVVAVALERALDDPRTLMIDEVVSGDAGTTVGYTVLRPGEDCEFYWPAGEEGDEGWESAPVVAVLAPAPLTEPFAWDRSDTTYSCSWEPDPSVPLALYYTDAPCELGPTEQILTTREAWEAWVSQAWDCDISRWGELSDSTGVPGEPGDPGDPDVPWSGGPDGRIYTEGLSIPVDFEQYAVIILRAGEQTRWGGGIWLTDLRATDAGSVIEYVVIEPEGDCPLISETGYGDSDVTQPTVAIRVPLPLPVPIDWQRQEIQVSCEWTIGVDSTGVVDGEGRAR